MVTDDQSTCPSHTSEFAADEEGLAVTLLYSKVTRQVLCIETGKEFVDLLLGFLTLPLGCIIKLLEEASLLELPSQGLASLQQDEKAVGSSNKEERTSQRDKKEGISSMTTIANLYDSVAKMEDTCLCVEKSLLLDPRPVAAFGGKLLPVSPARVKKDKTAIDYYCCGIACNFVCAKQGAKCPRHKRKMDTPCKVIDEDGEPHSNGDDTGFAKDGQYIITNCLEIYPSSAIKSLMHLNMLKSERVSDLDNMEIIVGTEEIADKHAEKLW